jgi:hypothetical protein
MLEPADVMNHLYSFFPLNPPKGDCGGLHSPTPPGSNIKLLAQTNYANPNVWKYRCLGFFIPLKRNPVQIGQSPAVELGCI